MKFLHYLSLKSRVAKSIFLACLLFLLQGCLVHWISDTNTRLQLFNRTPGLLTQLQIVSQDSSFADLVWISDTIQPGNRSLVIEKELVGKFHFRIQYRPVDCLQDSCWQWRDLGNRDVAGGSLVWHIREVENELTMDLK